MRPQSLTKSNPRRSETKVKITLFHLLALAGAFVAATENADATRNLRRALAADPKGSPAALAMKKDNDDTEPPDGFIELVAELDDEEEEKDEDAAEDDDPSGRRSLVACRTRCYLAGCRQYHYYYRTRCSHLMDCCQTYSGTLVTCL